MKPERWKQIEELFQAAFKLEPEWRVAFLRSACGEDADLLREVESLLASRAQEQGPETATVVTPRPLAPALIGQQLGHCQVLSLLGKGGMGEVYLARDTQLDRQVALKVLPPELALDPDRLQRFIREAKAASALKHPNIAVIHEIGEACGTHFIVMEYVEGGSLEARIRDHKLPLAEILDIGIQIADALEEAHRQGITHRDIKPANIMLTPRRQVKVLDFGLAKRTRPETAGEGTATLTASQTVPGVIMGTLQYMAPEQLLGQSADGRSDLWALGVVLYEMAAGERPFQGQTGFDLSAAILNQPPRPLPAEVPTELKALIERCLEKDPYRRYQQVGEVRVALEAIREGTVAPWVAWRYRLARRPWLTMASTVVILLLIAGALSLDWLQRRFWGGMPRVQSLAVLPLENLSGDKEQEYFADGMTEELITNLAKIGALKVISRTSMMQYKGTKKPLPQIAKELNVDAVIEGSVLREGGQVRITAQLIQASTDQQLWAESYQREMRGVLALQGEIASAIADKVRAAVTPTERARLTSARPVNPEAYEACLKGMQSWYKVTPQDIDSALEYFELALKNDPNYAAAYAGIAMVWLGRQQMGWTAAREAGPKAKAAALKAIELDSTLAQAHYSMASVKLLCEWDWAGAEVEFKRAIELNPNYPDARAHYSLYLMIMKRPEKGMAEIQRALELDPLNVWFLAIYGADLESAGRDDEAIVQFRKALRTSPDFPGAHWELSAILFRKAKYEESLAEMKAYYAGDREMEEALTQGYAQSGYRGAMRRAADTLTGRGRKSYVLPCDVAGLYAWAGEKAQALAWLEKGFEVRDPNMPYVSVVPDYDTLRSDPRFQDLLRRMNLLPLPKSGVINAAIFGPSRKTSIGKPS
jgi:TolB-like protein/predicted Ser/Thr protein kinase